MPPNSITLDFQKMPTVTVDGKTQKFQADKANNGFQEIIQGGVTYSLVKNAASGHFQMTIKGEPAALEKYNFGVGKGRVTNASFGKSESMDGFFKGTSYVGDQSEAPKYFESFSIGGAHLADRTAFLQSGAWGLDQNAAEKELNRLEKEAKKLAESKTEAKKDTEAKTESKPQLQVSDPAKKDQVDSSQKSNESVPVPTTAILKEKAVKLLNKMNKAQERLPSLKENSAAQDIRKSLSRLAEGVSLKSLKFNNSETEKLFLTSANDYLQGVDRDIDDFSNPKDASLELIEQYPTQFQAACNELNSADQLPSLKDQNLQSLSPEAILSKLQTNEKTKVLQLFEELVIAKVSSMAVDQVSSNSPSPTQKSAQLLINLGLQRQVVPGDGNCFFFAVAANDSRDSQDSSISKSPREANTRRDELLKTFQQLTHEQAQKTFRGKELFLTWDALQSGLLSEDQLSSAENNPSRPLIAPSSWGNSSHLKLNAIRTGKPQVAIDAASDKIYVYHPSGRYKSVDAKHPNAKSDLQEFIKEKDAQIYESLPGHWNAVQVAKE
jgi:hypothetical protein